MKSGLVATAMIAAALAGCDSKAQQEARELEERRQAIHAEAERVIGRMDAAEEANRAERAKVAAAEAEKGMKAVGVGRICRAAIAGLMGQNPNIIRATKLDGMIVDTSYVRPSDGTVWRNRCKIDGNQVAWAAKNGDVAGRWRSEDSIIYQVSGRKIRVVGSSYGEEIFDQTYTVN